MTGWTGGVANRTWKRDQRGPNDGRLGLFEDVAEILGKFRAEHDWQPGKVWDPYAGTYVRPGEDADA